MSRAKRRTAPPPKSPEPPEPPESAPPAQSAPSRAARPSLAERAARIYLTLDPRSLGAFRILFAALLLYDLLRRVGSIALWYESDGPVAHGALPLSLFNLCRSHTEVAIGFLLCGATYLALLAGYRTRIAQLCALVAVVSLHNRCPIVERSGEKLLDLLALWTVFLPLGARFSLDARSATRAATDGNAPPPRSIAVLALLLQVAAIYFYSGIQKTGPTWKNGTAMHYFLQRSDIVTALGVRVRDHLPLGLTRAFSYSTLAVEDLLPLLLLTPLFSRFARRVAIVLMILLHAGIAITVDLGIYQPMMVAICALFLCDADWDRLRKNRFARAFVARVRRIFPSLPPTAVTRSPPPRWLTWSSEAIAGLFLVAAIACALNQNDGVPALKHPPLPLLEPMMADLGLPEAWSRFAPDVPTSFRMLAVDAVTSDGRHVDPIAWAATGYEGPPFDRVPDRLGYDTFWHNYQRMVGTPLLRVNQPMLEAWILRHHERTGRPADRVVSFTLYGLVRPAPAPGATELPPPQRFNIAHRELPN